MKKRLALLLLMILEAEGSASLESDANNLKGDELASSSLESDTNNFYLRRNLKKGGGGSKDECFGEPAGGVHVCTLESANSKCGTKGSERNDARYRHVVCCCHSDTCPSACCETSITDVCGGNIDDALDENGVTIKDQTKYDCMKASIDACNMRGNTGDGETYVDMVAKCARVNEETDELYCPYGGATDPTLIPPGEICNPTSANAGTNPWCTSADSNSCSDDDSCLWEEQPI